MSFKILEYCSEFSETPAVPWLLMCGVVSIVTVLILHKITK